MLNFDRDANPNIKCGQAFSNKLAFAMAYIQEILSFRGSCIKQEMENEGHSYFAYNYKRTSSERPPTLLIHCNA